MLGDANVFNYFQVIEVSSNSAVAPETLGTKPKFWFDADGVRHLFKNDDRGTGEDWAEKIVCEIAALIGLPHVPYELAKTTNRSNTNILGVCCENLCAPNESLVMGNQLLGFKNPSYPVVPSKIYQVKEHQVAAVWEVLNDSKMGPPSFRWMANVPLGIQSAGDVFIGYVLLDALVGNQDRHHQNWGAVETRHLNSLALAPTFDHGAALARNEPDEKRKRRLQTKDNGDSLEQFAGRAASAFYKDSGSTKTLSTFEAATQFGAYSPLAGRVWQNNIADLATIDITAILNRIPNDRMTALAKEFTLRLMRSNQTRILDMAFTQ